MTVSVHSFNPEQNDGDSQEQQGMRSLWTTPPPRWTHYIFLLAIVGIVGAAVWTYFQSRPVSIGDIVGPPGNINRCDKPVTTWGTVTVAHFAEPGFDEDGTNLRGYWLEDKNELGLESEIAVFYDPAKISVPAVGQVLRVAGVLECSATYGPEWVTLIEQSRTVQQNITPTLGSP
jgi:hypothetical protein